MPTGVAGTSSTRTTAWTDNVNHFHSNVCTSKRGKTLFQSGGKIKFAFPETVDRNRSANTSDKLIDWPQVQ